MYNVTSTKIATPKRIRETDKNDEGAEKRMVGRYFPIKYIREERGEGVARFHMYLPTLIDIRV